MTFGTPSNKFNFRRIEILLAFVFLFGCVNSWGADAKYDKTRHDQVQRTIDGSTNKLLGISLENAARLLSLENVKWDAGYTSVPRGQLRVYHFNGFYLLLSLQVFPRGITPESQGQFSVNNSELRSNGVWWVANFYPALQVDGIADPKERMSNYWEQVHAGFQKRTEEMNAARAQQKWAKFASCVSNHLDDLALLQKKLQAEQIHCLPAASDLGYVSFLVESNDFVRAHAAADKIISENSLTVNVAADIIGLGLEIWEKGKKTSTVYF